MITNCQHGDSHSDGYSQINTTTYDQIENNYGIYHNRNRSKNIFLLLAALLICKCGFAIGSSTEPSECLAVLCDMECPSDSKSVKIDLDSVSFVTNSSILHSKRKRAIIDRHREQLVRHLREVNETQKCCECKCDFAKCPEFMCPDHQYKSTVLAGTRIPGSCCPKFQCMTERPTCFSLNLQRHFNPLDKWKDDSCTQCECSETGEMNCESPACKPLSCEKKQVVEGECCPVCDINDSKFCEPECDLHCRNGFEHDPVRNCATCKCVKSTPITKVTTTVAMGPDDVDNSTIVTTTILSPIPDNVTSDDSDSTTDFVDNSNYSLAKPPQSWYVHLPLNMVLGISVTIVAFGIIVSLTCRHISHKKDKHHLNRKQNTPLI